MSLLSKQISYLKKTCFFNEKRTSLKKGTGQFSSLSTAQRDENPLLRYFVRFSTSKIIIWLIFKIGDPKQPLFRYTVQYFQQSWRVYLKKSNSGVQVRIKVGWKIHWNFQTTTRKIPVLISCSVFSVRSSYPVRREKVEFRAQIGIKSKILLHFWTGLPTIHLFW